ncbi:pyridoxamine 5-phosphate oxidase (plasmid) [Microvirga ossetica]|uniref:Pyridoxamine 5-phosphate oxidase n=1 Tax=Microvirga ossetica TaxID=1882682 RepID=A0A1B2EXP8_9HYPH|nr:pyridoxamine 5'-phosphate oxidase family protein [Microvirga ossetica]ANY84760.1 pyridoxamine 5-phosphate oxidase [Microvirga ossetica]
MLHKYLEIASTPAVKAAREHYGSAAQYAKLDGSLGSDGAVRNDRLGLSETEFISSRDGFYLATASEANWPYVQFRGGPSGFLRVMDKHTLGYADFRGNRQYVSIGNVAGNDRVSLFLMDYAHQRRLKIFGRMQVVDARADPKLAEKVAVPDYPGRVERAILITVEAFDWNCPQHITPRFTESEIRDALAPVYDELATLRAENDRLKRELNAVPSQPAIP